MNKEKYNKVSGIYKKLRQAENMEVPIYISGAVAFGKTSAVEYFYRKKAHLCISGEEGYLEQMPELSQIKQKVVVMDDLSWISDSESKKYVIDLIKQRKKYGYHVVLIGRSRLSGWLRVTAMEEEFIFADERDLMMNRDEVRKVMEEHNIFPTEDELTQIMTDTYGHPLAVIYDTYHLNNQMLTSMDIEYQGTADHGQTQKLGCGYSPIIANQVQLDLFHYYDQAFYEKWDEQMREVLLALCQYPSFTIRMAEMITGNNRIPIIFEKAMSVGNFMIKIDDETYAYRIQLRYYFQWKQDLTYTQEQKNVNYEHAALYYEIMGQVELALKYYKLAGDENQVAQLLVKNAKKHPGTAHFFETREYYFSLPEKDIKQSAILMSGMSMLHAIMFQPEQSDYWYNQLLEYEKKMERGSQERKEAATRIAYLNIALPQKGIHGIIKSLRNTAIICMNKQVQLPEFSVTSNMPSIMNGGLDFCEWSRSDKELGILMKKPVEIVLGKYGVGLVNIALAESGMENKTMDSYEIQTRLNNGYLRSDTGGKIEMCFAATGLLIKEHLSQGQPKLAESLYHTFYEKVMKEKANQLIPNMKTLYMWMHLMMGDIDEAKNWLQKAPNDMIAFCILDRYQYINKVRCLIGLDRKEEALGLVERMNLYYTQYERNYLWIENQILKSILLYRMGMTEWKRCLEKVLIKAEHFHFYLVFSMEGAALKPLLDEFQTSVISADYIEKIKEETNRIATYYPHYLSIERELIEPLTVTEQKILSYLCNGKSSKEICEMNCISYSGFKFHTHNIYKKLGVGNRADAEREAKRLGLNR